MGVVANKMLQQKLREFEAERWGQTTRRMQIAIIQGDRREAIRALDDFLESTEYVVVLRKRDSIFRLQRVGVHEDILQRLDKDGHTRIGTLLDSDDKTLRSAGLSLLQVTALDQGLELAGFRRRLD